MLLPVSRTQLLHSLLPDMTTTSADCHTVPLYQPHDSRGQQASEQARDGLCMC